MWLLSGILDGKNNRSAYFDVGVQYALNDDTALKINPAFALGFDSLNAKEGAEHEPFFVDIQIPVGIMYFPFIDTAYTLPVFFALSVTPGMYFLSDSDGSPLKYFSIGALLEAGYQRRLSYNWILTVSIGVARMFSILLPEVKDIIPRYNLYSPWPIDSGFSPRFRVALGYWL
jgi:hypothetical protein